MATKDQHRDTEKYLVDHGADVNMKDGVGDRNCLYLLDSSALDVNDSSQMLHISEVFSQSTKRGG